MIGLGRTGDARPPVWLGAGLIWWRPGRVRRALGGIHLATDGWQNVASRLACAAPWRQDGVKVPAGGDAQFGEYLAEVPFNGAGADEQFRADLGVGAPVSGQADDVLLLRGELAKGVDLAFADLLAGGEQLPAGALGEGVGADHGEQVVGGVQLPARVEPPLLATEPLAV